MELTEEEVGTIYAVLNEKKMTLETNTQRAIKRLTVYQQAPDCSILYDKAKKTVDGNICHINRIEAIMKKLTY